MNNVVDRILNTYQLVRPLDADQLSESRQKITRYVESLASAGQGDALNEVGGGVRIRSVAGLVFYLEAEREFETFGLEFRARMSGSVFEHGVDLSLS